jgi:hypothetical protein
MMGIGANRPLDAAQLLDRDVGLDIGAARNALWMAARSDIDDQPVRLWMELVQPVDGFRYLAPRAGMPMIDVRPNLIDLIVFLPH